MRQDVMFGLASGIVVSLLSWDGNHTPSSVSIFPNGLTVLVLISMLFGIARVQRRDGGSVDLATTVRRIMPVGVVAGLVLAVTTTLLGIANFTQFSWTLFGFGIVAAFASCVGWAALVATVAWAVRHRPHTV